MSDAVQDESLEILVHIVGFRRKKAMAVDIDEVTLGRINTRLESGRMTSPMAMRLMD